MRSCCDSDPSIEEKVVDHRAKAAGDAEKSIVRWGFKICFTGDTLIVEVDCWRPGSGAEAPSLPVLKAFTVQLQQVVAWKRQEPEVGTVEGLRGLQHHC
jgi:hypothetical protein